MTKNKDEENFIQEQERMQDTEIQDKKILEADYDVAGDNDSKAFENQAEEDISLSEILMISRVGKCYSCFAIVDSLASVLSSYFYSWLTCYGDHYEYETVDLVVIIIEIFFLVNMLVKFITDYTEEGEKFPVKDWIKIAKRYLKNGFITDLIPIIPLQWMFSHGKFKVKILYMPKIIRFIGGFEIFDIRYLNKMVKQHHKSYILAKIKKEPYIADD